MPTLEQVLEYDRIVKETKKKGPYKYVPKGLEGADLEQYKEPEVKSTGILKKAFNAIKDPVESKNKPEPEMTEWQKEAAEVEKKRSEDIKQARRMGIDVDPNAKSLSEGLKEVGKRGAAELREFQDKPLLSKIGLILKGLAKSAFTSPYEKEVPRNLDAKSLLPIGEKAEKLLKSDKDTGAISKLARGVAVGGAKLVEGMADPRTLLELGAAAVNPGSAAGFIPGMVEASGEGVKKVYKKAKEGDLYGVGEGGVETVAPAVFAKSIGKHTFKPEVTPKISLKAKQKAGDLLPVIQKAQDIMNRPKEVKEMPSGVRGKIEKPKVEPREPEGIIKTEADLELERGLGKQLVDEKGTGIKAQPLMPIRGKIKENVVEHSSPIITPDDVQTWMPKKQFIKTSQMPLSNFIKKQGGFSVAQESGMKGELKWLREGDANLVKVSKGRSKNRSADSMLEKAKESGMLQEDATISDMFEVIKAEQTNKSSGRKQIMTENDFAEAEIERGRATIPMFDDWAGTKNKGNIKPVEASFLQLNDEIKTPKDTYKVIDKNDGGIIIKDGDTHTVPNGYEVPAISIKRKLSVKKSLKDTISEQDVETAELIGDVNAPIGMTVQKSRLPVKKKFSIEFKDKDFEQRYQAASKSEQVGVVQKAKELAQKIVDNVRYKFPELKGSKYSQLRFYLNKIEKQKAVQRDTAIRSIYNTVVNLNDKEFDAFQRSVLLADLKAEANLGNKLPFDLTPEKVNIELDGLQRYITPEVMRSLAKRKQLWEALKNDYVESAKEVGFNVGDRFTKEDYFRHQIIDYARNKLAPQGSANYKMPTGRGFLKKRKGSSKDISTDYLAVESEVMSQMMHDIQTFKFIKELDRYDLGAKLKAEYGKDWKKAIPEDYGIWQPREGSMFFQTMSIPEKQAIKLITENGGIGIEDLRSVLAKGGKFREYVLPKEVIQTLDKPIHADTAFEAIVSKPVGAWKEWQLISPRRYLKYNLRNLTGDGDITMAGNPNAFRRVPKVVGELWDLYKGNKPMTEDMKGFFERGGMKSTLQVAEMSDIKTLSMFEHLIEKEVNPSLWHKYWRYARLTTDFREAILRYSNYIEYLEQMKANNGKPKNFGASVPEEVMQLKSIQDRAYKLSNDLIGAYDDISVGGQFLRKYIFPFWSFKEANFKRYIQLFRNAANDGELTKAIGRKMAGTAIRSPLIAARIGKFVLKATMLIGLVQAWNQMIYPEEEASLPEGVRKKPHIILYKDKDGRVVTFNRLGALSDFLETFSLDDAPQDIADFLSGRRTIKEISEDMAKAPVNVFVSGLSPQYKLPVELATGRSTYPDVFEPYAIRDRMQFLAQSAGLENEYAAIKGLPSKGYVNSLNDLYSYSYDPSESAFNNAYGLKMSYLKKKGLLGEYAGSYTPKSNALYYFKKAVKLGDKEAADKYLAEFYTLGGTKRGLNQSIKMMHPLFGIKNKNEYINSLTNEDKQTLNMAIQYWKDVIKDKSKLDNE